MAVAPRTPVAQRSSMPDSRARRVRPRASARARGTAAPAARRSTRDHARDAEAEWIGHRAAIDQEREIDAEHAIRVLRGRVILRQERPVDLLRAARGIEQVVERKHIVAVALKTADLGVRLSLEPVAILGRRVRDLAGVPVRIGERRAVPLDVDRAVLAILDLEMERVRRGTEIEGQLAILEGEPVTGGLDLAEAET